MKNGEIEIKYVKGIKVICNHQLEGDKSEVENRVFKILITSIQKNEY
ncbi:hypothetical protein SH1V18_02920 [Vallitalea longa]|uniref:Uncharacterized protein n=1 Tax=Vallitalea longa TaxID=2936439 RepID=A0A9W6DDZ0_9FIRM|nr:hypothetical protein [Vallitalea longa]GKX27812.1 hypothetical protein SH1V18_02920 [Vallitalea longa]